jgi:hypothetical protein
MVEEKEGVSEKTPSFLCNFCNKKGEKREIFSQVIRIFIYLQKNLQIIPREI